MNIDAPLIEARLIRRYKRFLADVELAGGAELTVHFPNPGSMEGCKAPGSRVILRDSRNPSRKLRYTLQTIEVDGVWVNVDTILPNAVVAEAIEAGSVPELAGYATLRREVRYGEGSRIDLLLERPGSSAGAPAERCYVEVKATTLARAGVACFPDAVTQRGRKHLEELARMVAEGHRAAMFFFVSRGDVGAFAPADDIDPAYGATLRRVADLGVELFAYRARVEPGCLAVGERLGVQLHSDTPYSSPPSG